MTPIGLLEFKKINATLVAKKITNRLRAPRFLKNVVVF